METLEKLKHLGHGQLLWVKSFKEPSRMTGRLLISTENNNSMLVNYWPKTK